MMELESEINVTEHHQDPPSDDMVIELDMHNKADVLGRGLEPSIGGDGH